MDSKKIWIGVTKHGTPIKGIRRIEEFALKGFLADTECLYSSQVPCRVAIRWRGEWTIVRRRDALARKVHPALWRRWAKSA